MKRCGNRLAGALLLMALLAAVHTDALAKHCSVAVAQDISFGTYDPLQSGNLDTGGLIRITCSAHTPNVSIKLGAGLSGSFQPRYMHSGGEQLAYNLYMDASRITVWGDGTSGTDFFFFDELNDIDLPVYARTPLGQSVTSGSYSDTIVVTVEW